jgi:hypothetical protein
LNICRDCSCQYLGAVRGRAVNQIFGGYFRDGGAGDGAIRPKTPWGSVKVNGWLGLPAINHLRDCLGTVFDSDRPKQGQDGQKPFAPELGRKPFKLNGMLDEQVGTRFDWVLIV